MMVFQFVVVLIAYLAIKSVSLQKMRKKLTAA
jgi:hypothetical protein